MSQEQSVATQQSRDWEMDRIHTEAVGVVMGGCCQIFSAIAQELNAVVRKHCGTNRVFVSSAEEREASGLVESMKAALADDLPVDPTNAVESQDDFNILSDEEAEAVAAKVRKTVEELLGVFRV